MATLRENQNQGLRLQAHLHQLRTDKRLPFAWSVVHLPAPPLLRWLEAGPGRACTSRSGVCGTCVADTTRPVEEFKPALQQ